MWKIDSIDLIAHCSLLVLDILGIFRPSSDKFLSVNPEW